MGCLPIYMTHYCKQKLEFIVRVFAFELDIVVCHVQKAKYLEEKEDFNMRLAISVSVPLKHVSRHN